MAILLSLFSLTSLFVGTFAWFISVRSQETTADNFVISRDDLKASYSIYKYDTTTDSPVVLDNFLENFALNQYDVIFKERNKYVPLYIKIELTGSNLGTNGSIKLHLNRNSSISAMDENNKLRNNFTSVTKFAVSTNTAHFGSIYDHTSVNNTWNNLNDAFYNIDMNDNLATLKFTSGTNGNYIKEDKLVFNLSYAPDDFQDNKLIIYLYINYDQHLTEAYSQQHDISLSALGLDLSYRMLNDLTSIYITHFDEDYCLN